MKLRCIWPTHVLEKHYKNWQSSWAAGLLTTFSATVGGGNAPLSWFDICHRRRERWENVEEEIEIVNTEQKEFLFAWKFQIKDQNNLMWWSTVWYGYFKPFLQWINRTIIVLWYIPLPWYKITYTVMDDFGHIAHPYSTLMQNTQNIIWVYQKKCFPLLGNDDNHKKGRR